MKKARHSEEQIVRMLREANRAIKKIATSLRGYFYLKINFLQEITGGDGGIRTHDAGFARMLP